MHLCPITVVMICKKIDHTHHRQATGDRRRKMSRQRGSNISCHFGGEEQDGGGVRR